MTRKYVRGRATARLAVLGLGDYVRLDRDEVPRGTIPESVAKEFCRKNGMRYREGFTSAAFLFDKYRMKLENTSRRSRKKASAPAPGPRVIRREIELRRISDGALFTVPSDNYNYDMEKYPIGQYELVRHIEIRGPKPRPKPGAETAFSQAYLF